MSLAWIATWVLPWTGISLIMVGLWQLGFKRRSAFIWTIIGESMWITSAFYREIWDLAFVSFLFLALAIRNWYKWAPPKESEDERQVQCG